MVTINNAAKFAVTAWAAGQVLARTQGFNSKEAFVSGLLLNTGLKAAQYVIGKVDGENRIGNAFRGWVSAPKENHFFHTLLEARGRDALQGAIGGLAVAGVLSYAKGAQYAQVVGNPAARLFGLFSGAQGWQNKLTQAGKIGLAIAIGTLLADSVAQHFVAGRAVAGEVRKKPVSV